VSFDDPKLWDDLENENSSNYKQLEEVLLHLAVCHSIIIDERKGKYNASSPDELALVNAAKYFGAVFSKRDEESNIFIDFKGKQLKYKLLNILEFTSTRKRMSVIVEDPNGNIVLLCKGADSMILERLNKSKSPFVNETLQYIEGYAQEGLRTLLLAKRNLDKPLYDKWNK
jgi:magnesium-transporting ATPase (P-type)